MINKTYVFSLNQNLLIVLLLSFILYSCTKQDVSPTVAVQDQIDATAKVKFQGSFINGPYGSVTGDAKIYVNNGKFTLSLNNISVSNGPDLHVYLSKEVLPISFIDLGRLKSTNGTQVYDINGMPDFISYKYALIHCQQFDHLFGSAELKLVP